MRDASQMTLKNKIKIRKFSIFSFFFVFDFLVSVTGVTSPSHGWITAGKGLTYKISDKSLPWLDAREECQKKSGKLATIENEKLNEFMKTILKKDQLYWTGLSEDLYKKWSWEDVIGHPIYTNWAPGQPYNEEGVSGCAVIDGKGTWQVSHCETSRKFICQKIDNGLDDDDQDHDDSSLSKKSRPVDEVPTKRIVVAGREQDKKKNTLQKRKNRNGQNQTKTPTAAVRLHKKHDMKNNKTSRKQHRRSHIPNPINSIQKTANNQHKRSHVNSVESPIHSFLQQRSHVPKASNKSLEQDLNSALSEEKLDAANMELLKENLREFSLTPDNSPSTPILELAHFATGAKRGNVRKSGTRKHKIQKAKSGKESRKCVFPFVYNGNTHYTCIPGRKNENKRWCSLSSNYDRDLQWKNCLNGPDNFIETNLNGNETHRSNISTFSNHSVGSGQSEDHPKHRQLKEIKSMIGAVLENEGVSHNEQKQILEDLEGGKKAQTNKQERFFVYNDDVGSLEDEEEKLLAEEFKTHQYITDIGLNKTTINFVVPSRKNNTDLDDRDNDNNSQKSSLIINEKNETDTSSKNQTTKTQQDNLKTKQDENIEDNNEKNKAIKSKLDNKDNERKHSKNFTVPAKNPQPAKTEPAKNLQPAKTEPAKNPQPIVSEHEKEQTTTEANELHLTKQPALNKTDPIARGLETYQADGEAKPLSKLMKQHMLEYEKTDENLGINKEERKTSPKDKPIDKHILQYEKGDKQGNLSRGIEMKDPMKEFNRKNDKENAIMYDYFKKYVPDLPKPRLTVDLQQQQQQNAVQPNVAKTLNKNDDEKQSHNANKIYFTEGGTGGGKACVFPFIYESTTHWDCTEMNSAGRPWCSTSPRHSFDAHPLWGYCKNEEPSNLPVDLKLNTDEKQQQSLEKEKNSADEYQPATAAASIQSNPNNQIGSNVELNGLSAKNPAADQLKDEVKSQASNQIDSSTVNDMTVKDTSISQLMQHAHRKANLHTNGEELLSTDSGLRTYDGNSNGARCMIPFIFDGKTHSQCIMLNENESWCSATHNYDKNMKWGKCCNLEKCGEDWSS